MNVKIIIGMSGGVDSSAAAYLLKKLGYEPIGVTMQTAGDETAARDAALVCKHLQMQHHVVNLEDRFKKQVIKPFVEAYLSGKTPNPCVVCNSRIKWEFLLEEAAKLGCDTIATGHYAFTGFDETKARYVLKRASSVKDQSYALYRLTQAQLAKTIMPLFGYNKEEVRAIAEKAAIPVFDKPDSQEICFVPQDSDYMKYIREYTGKAPEKGSFVDENGSVLGEHQGIYHYTTGQRKGLGLAFGTPMFVKSISAADNTVTLAADSRLFETTMYAEDINLISEAEINEPKRFKAKIRYNHFAADCTAVIENGRIKCVFDEPQRAVTPGQSLVLYDLEGYVVGGGVIVS